MEVVVLVAIISAFTAMALMTCLMLYRLAARALGCIDELGKVISRTSAELLALKAETMTGSASLSSRILAHNLSPERIAEAEPDRKPIAESTPEELIGNVLEPNAEIIGSRL